MILTSPLKIPNEPQKESSYGLKIERVSNAAGLEFIRVSFVNERTKEIIGFADADREDFIKMVSVI